MGTGTGPKTGWERGRDQRRGGNGDGDGNEGTDP